jgi:RHS repeat-associated protein
VGRAARVLTQHSTSHNDGMRVIQERNASNMPTVSFARGNDLSASLEGAGGIGGLLGRSHGYSSGTWSTHNHYHADGNGNVTYLVNSGQTPEAIYRYDPYGRTMSQSGTLATANRYRFSSKETHSQSGMYYYGFRFYEPHLQRWVNRDPLGDLVGLRAFGYNRVKRLGNIEGWDGFNIHAFSLNDPFHRVDPYGLYSPDEWEDIIWAGLDGFGQGSGAVWDGIIPFWDPFERNYDPCDELFQGGQVAGSFARDVALGVGLAGLAKRVAGAAAYEALPWYQKPLAGSLLIWGASKYDTYGIKIPPLLGKKPL